ncbi:MAG: L,D-transpeptidase [Hyphomicrobiaceae bacterium]|nr:L,D-transpeptidase [Hyphomicrobiaceae bacterium]
MPWRRRCLTLLGLAMLATSWGATELAARGRTVTFAADYPRGTIIVINNERRLYFVLGDGKALRYRVAVGNRSELWTGRTFVSAKRKNPSWTPVDGGETVRGGLSRNPLGKRALYLDWSLLRIHGTPSRGSVGRAVSNGCIRMLNEDVIDLYDRVHIGAPVIAVNARRHLDRFLEPVVSGKLPARTDQTARRRGR